jgi:N-acetylmuramoyl-L-alanine amidase
MIYLRSLRRLLLMVGAVFTLIASAHAEPTPATLIVGGKPVPFIVKPYVGPEGQVYAPVDAVRLLNANYTPDPDARTVTVTGEKGKTISVPYELVQGRYCVPIQKVVEALGASTDWQPTTQTLTVRARLLMVRQENDTLTIDASYPVYYRVQRIGNPARVFVDLYGLDLAAQAANIPLASGNIRSIRTGQMDYNIVRIVVDLKKNVPFQVQSQIATDQVRVALGSPGEPFNSIAARPNDSHLPSLPTMPAPSIATRPLPILPHVPLSQGIQITGVSMKTTGGLTQVLISTTGQAKYSTELLDNPYRLAFDLAGATPDSKPQPLVAADNAVMKDVRVGVFRSGDSHYGRVVVDLEKIVPFTVTHQDGPDGTTIYSINLQTPMPPMAARPFLPMLPTIGTSLAGKIIVVDPGHGGKDSGTVGLGGIEEKQLTLAIGLKLQDALEQNGATALLTRDTDVFIPLPDRPLLAIDHHADIFVSVHCDQIGAVNSHSGTTVYFHGWDPIDRRLAADISADVAASSGLPEDGTKSDMMRYGGRFDSGYAVLRGSPMPAVLVECGYLNNASDLTRLTDPDVQQEIATGIVAGIRDFLAGRTASR